MLTVRDRCCLGSGGPMSAYADRCAMLDFIRHLFDPNETVTPDGEASELQLQRHLAMRITELQTLVEMLPVGLAIATDVECRAIRSNRAFSAILGIQPGANASLTAPDSEASIGLRVYCNGTEIPPAELPMQRAAREGVTIHGFEMKVVRADGVKVDLICDAAPIFDEARVCRGAVGVFHDISERKAAEERLLKSLQEKQVLLHEIHHRVKNNLQFIISLLRLQSVEVSDVALREVLDDTRTRVHAMALVHEKLYRAEDFSRLDYHAYLRELATSAARSMSERAAHVSISVEADPIGLETNAAVPVGFIVNELVSNSLKHAFPGGRAGKVEVRLHGNPDSGFDLSVNDDGVGCAVDFDPAAARSMGWRLVGMLVRQLAGTAVMKREDGTKFAVHFAPRHHS